MCQIKFSLIVPHHNTPDLLSRLLQTVPKRADLQIIIVDDCSNKFLDRLYDLRTKYNYVEFYSTSINGGGGKARNIGLSHAQGKYVFFADSDDYFTPGINILLDRYSKDNIDLDLIFFNAQSVYSDTYLPSRRVKHLNKFMSEYAQNPNQSIINLKFLFGEPWCKLINRRLIMDNQIKFEEIPVHNDTQFSYLIGYYASTIAVDNIAAYCVTERPISVSSYPFDNKLLIRTEVFAQKNKFLKDHKIEVFDNLMMSPFKLAIKKRKSCLSDLYTIASKYGYSKYFIKIQLMKECCNYILRSFQKIFH